jgi:hypothetical protein
MALYADLEPVIKQLTSVCLTDDAFGMGKQMGINYALEILGKVPLVEAEPVVHAHWVIEKKHSVSQNPYMDDNYHAHATCSNCGFIVDSRNASFGYPELKTTKFCSECGAHMDEEVAE